MPVVCSNCGVEKRQVNHWFLVWLERGDTRLCITEYDEDPAMQHETSVAKVCGESCLMRMVARFCARKSAVVAGVDQ